MKYAIRDTMTGQVYSGLSIKEVANMLKVRDYHVYRVINNNSLIGKRFSVFKEVGCEDVLIKTSLPPELLKEWDTVTEKFKIYYNNTNAEVLK